MSLSVCHCVYCYKSLVCSCMYMYIVYISVYIYCIFNFPAEPNSGYVLWIQQFYALLVKRFLHSIRNWRAIIIQIVLPVMFILLGLILIETVPGVRDADELRMMSLPESALIEDDIITFFAEFGNGPRIFEVSNTSCY